MNAEFWTRIMAQILEGLVPLVILLVGMLIRNVLVKYNASKEQIQLVEGAYDILARAARTTN
jgi:hypothetical protein